MPAVLAGGLPRTIPVDDASRVGQARRVVQQLAESLGFDEVDAGRASLVAMELATNILKHAQRGELRLQQVASPAGTGLEIVSVDKGPGFDAAACFDDGFSTRGTQGIGLGAVARQSDVMDLYADARGAVVLARLYKRGTPHQDLRYGAAAHAVHGESVSGDAWRIAFDGTQANVLMIDGLGHGLLAHDAAQQGVAGFDADPLGEPDTLMASLHQSMHGSRGGAVALARYDGDSGALRFAGIGNLSAATHNGQGSRGLASHPGIVGTQYRKMQTFDFPESRGRLLIMHSDGLLSRWSLRDYPDLLGRHPAVVATVLLRDHDRGRDDATVVALALGHSR
ncbi:MULTISPECIES: ATP-binding protein [Lysobacteraceae]|uniref:ATP-binding protein n=1 Tax=Lysobacteraceae TaxID=32033 RepID=UPI001BCA8038|nr:MULTISPECIES: ATP-binding protein [Lysobacter]